MSADPQTDRVYRVLLVRFTWDVVVLLFIPILFIAALLPSRKRSIAIWGSFPVLNWKYLSKAVNGTGIDSITMVDGLQPINSTDDFDRYFEDFAWRILPQRIQRRVGACLALCFVLRRCSVLHTLFNGFSLSQSSFWRLEGWLLRRAHIPVVILPVGGDIWLYSRIIDPSVRYGLLCHYPNQVREESRVKGKVDYWVRHADVIIGNFLVGDSRLSRWDVTTPQYMVMDLDEWANPNTTTLADGVNGQVTILHTPNHRTLKGTEFIIDAVDCLVEEGLNVRLELLEGAQNSLVRERMHSADIVADQLILTGYALTALEGMASGLPVLTNLGNDSILRVFRRYSFLNECPILSTDPESVLHNLRTLVTNPGLRRQLGEAGRLFVETYHSFAAAQFLFQSIYQYLESPGSVDLLSLYHPITGKYPCSGKRIEHPLIENRLPTTGNGNS